MENLSIYKLIFLIIVFKRAESFIFKLPKDHKIMLRDCASTWNSGKIYWFIETGSSKKEGSASSFEIS